MIRSDKNRIQMFRTVKATLEKNKTLWEKVPAFDESFGTFAELLGIIDTTTGKQLAPTTGTTESRDTLRTQLEDELMDVADALGALAHKTKDPVLGSKVELTLSSVGRLDSLRVLDLAQRVLKLAEENATELTRFLHDPKDVEQLKAVTERFEVVQTKPREAIAERALQTRALPELVRAVTLLLRNDLDRQMNLFRRRQPEFFGAYRSARIIVDSGLNTGPRETEKKDGATGEEEGKEKKG